LKLAEVHILKNRLLFKLFASYFWSLDW